MKKYLYLLSKLLLVCIIYSSLVLVRAQTAKAQSISLSLTPSLTELVIMPGKEFTQRYLLTNQGQDTVIKVSIAPFIQDDEVGNVQLQKDLLTYDPANIKDWFIFSKPKIAPGGSFFLPRGSTSEIIVSISPPPDAPHGDYYLTLLFETDVNALVGGQGLVNQAKIGTNILLTVSKDGMPKKESTIVEFVAPRVIDSLMPLVYKVKIRNSGTAFFKPKGTISVSQTLNEIFTLPLAPFNILAGTTRQIPCMNEEKLVACQVPQKMLLGLYRANLKYNIEDTDLSYQKTTYTLAFPFLILFSLIASLTVLSLIKKKVKRK